jgi:hypothetical protein
VFDNLVMLAFILFFFSAIECYTQEEFQAQPCLNNCSNGQGICDTQTDTCTCTGGYTGVPCQFAPGEDQCQTPADCGNDLCDGWQCTGPPTFAIKTCVKNLVVCDNSNLCLVMGNCDPQTGQCVLIQNKTALCNDGNSCTDDICTPSTGICTTVSRSCAYLDTSCKTGYCDPTQPQDAQCFVQDVICPNPDSCGSVFCIQNTTFCGCEYKSCPIGSTLPPTPPPTPCKTAQPTSAPTIVGQPTTPTQTLAPTPPTAPKSGLETGAIIGIVVGAVIGALILIIIIALVIYKLTAGSPERV